MSRIYSSVSIKYHMVRQLSIVDVDRILGYLIKAVDHDLPYDAGVFW